jgi:cytochrome c55X
MCLHIDETGALPPFFFRKSGAVLGLLLIGALSASLPACAAEAAEPTPARAKQLVHLVRQDCGACHGLTLNGGLGPALTAEALRDKPADSLTATILGGRPGTPMPPFRGIVADSEAAWIVRQLQAGFPSL